MPNVVTIREAIRRAKEDGLDISEYALRQWVRNGEIPSRIAGRSKILLFYPNVVDFITCGSCAASEAPAQAAGADRDFRR